MKKIPVEIYFFIGMITSFPVIDILNGFFLASNLAISIGTIYRTLFFLFLLVSVLLKKIPNSVFSLIFFLFLIGNGLNFLTQHIFLQNPLNWIVDDIGAFVKYFLWVLIPFYVNQRTDFFDKRLVENVFIWLNVFFTVGLLIPYLFGVGTYTYAASNAGFKGYFFAQNDLACAFIILITFSGWQLLKKIKTNWGTSLVVIILLFLADFLCLLLMGMKTGVVYGVVVVIYVLIALLLNKSNQSWGQRTVVWFVSIGVVFFVSLRGMAILLKMVEGTYNRMVYFYYLYGGDWVRLLSSSRSDYLKGGMTLFLDDKHFPVTFFVGQGFAYRDGNFGRLGLIEMDFFDIIFGLGVMGISLFIVMIGYFLIKSLKSNSRSIYSLLFIVTLAYSFFAGHVFFSAISSTMLGLIIGGIMLAQKK
ncbi:O-antigen ligase family protein [Carnobacterium maltaromaticum]|uniref:O-antigen ligase family protein n=1 Tax=Carnobacterium maltaromaticum TaxID=2751 RepID=UPI0012F7C640|nr:O-antigen ligase family protein [Carnobacterium maltaromaticum]